MKNSLRLVVAGCLFSALLLNAPVAWAEGAGSIASGTIAFVGAVVESTCDVNAENTADLIAAPSTVLSQQHACANTAANASLAAAPQRYQVSVTSLSDATNDQVLKYFNNYVRDSQGSAAHPVLVTQTYE